MQRALACAILSVLLNATPALQARDQQSKSEELLPTFTGIVRGLGRDTLTLERADANTIDFHCTRKTRYLEGKNKIQMTQIKPGDAVSVEARRAPDGSLDAVTVRLEHPKASL